MSKKIILLALAAASVAAFAMPATAMAVEEDVPVHVVGVELERAKTIDGEGSVRLTVSSGTITCTASSGTAEFTSSTTGIFEQTFTACSGATGTCTTAGQASGTITTTVLPFHLLTVEDSVTHATGPGVLVTPNATTGVFAHFECPLIGKVTLEGNGLVGTITKPTCGQNSTEVTIQFNSSSTGVQTHKTVVGTSTEYSLSASGSAASEDASGIITLGVEAAIECT